MVRLIRLVEMGARLLLATIGGLVYEKYWFNKDHILGYLWLINTFRLKERQVEQRWADVLDNYTNKASVLVNLANSLVLWLLFSLQIVRRPSSAFGVLKTAFFVGLFFYTSQLSVMLMTDVHWMPYLFCHIHTAFLLLIQTFCLLIRFSSRSERQT